METIGGLSVLKTLTRCSCKGGVSINAAFDDHALKFSKAASYYDLFLQSVVLEITEVICVLFTQPQARACFLDSPFCFFL